MQRIQNQWLLAPYHVGPFGSTRRPNVCALSPMVASHSAFFLPFSFSFSFFFFSRPVTCFLVRATSPARLMRAVVMMLAAVRGLICGFSLAVIGQKADRELPRIFHLQPAVSGQLT